MPTVTPRIATVLPTTGKQFHWLVGALLLQLVASPFLVGKPALIIQDLLFLGILLAALRVARRSRLHRLNCVLAGLCGVAVVLKYSLVDDWYIDVAVSLVGATVILLTAVEMIDYLSRQRRVDLDTVLGGLCVYLFLGAMWFSLYALLGQFDSAAFDFTVHGRDLPEHKRESLLFFFSYVTLLTTGYGDVIPLSPLARTLAVLEGLLGQFYLVFFMARLVGLHVAEKGGAAPSSAHSEDGKDR
jgi:hypothetical protein